VAWWDWGSKWNLNKHLPTAILIMQSRGGTATAGAAVKELESRLQAGTLKAGDAAVLVERGLKLQENREAVWAQEWGDFLESAWSKGLLNEEQKAQYAKNIVAFQFVMRNPAREGQKCGVSLEVSLARSGNKMQFNITPSLQTMHIGERAFSGGNMSSTIGMMGSGGTGTVSEEIDLNVPPGAYDVESVWRVSVTTPASANPLAEWETTERDRVEVLSRDAELIKRIRDETLRPAMETALSVSRVAVSGEGAATRCTGRIQIKNPPAPMAFDVIVRDQTGREWKVGVVTVKAGAQLTHSTSFAADTPGLAGGPVDVIFRSSLDAAMRTVFIKEMWEGEIVVKAVDPAAGR
jgi:hypothetical protein